jgi:hypothetical protein
MRGLSGFMKPNLLGGLMTVEAFVGSEREKPAKERSLRRFFIGWVFGKVLALGPSRHKIVSEVRYRRTARE